MTSDYLAIIVPMKPFNQAKQRLRPAVNDNERVALARAMLIHVLATIHASGVGDLHILISADPTVLALAPDHGFTPLIEETTGYNDAVKQAAHWSQTLGAAAILVLPADLPHLTPRDIQDLVSLAANTPRAVLLAPDAAETGTNALLLRPPDLLPPHFGPDSFWRHLALARAAGVDPIVYRHANIARDIDWPSDLWLLK